VDTLRRIVRDIKNLRFIEAYAVSAIAIALAIGSIFGDTVSVGLRWSVVLAGMALLVYRVTVPAAAADATERIFGNRVDLDGIDIDRRLRNAQKLAIYAPTGINFLTPERCDVLRESILARDESEIRVVVLDPDLQVPVDLAAHQLDSVDFQVQSLRPSLDTVIDRLRQIAGWPARGSFSYRLLGYNPGFSIVLVDPEAKDGLIIVEIHAFHHESIASRMHIVLTRADSERWFTHWIGQFDHIWSAARKP
jgi:hypothetical protein